MKMATKQQSLDDQLRQFDNEDDNISLADLMQKATKAQDAKNGAKAEKNSAETNFEEVTAVKKKRVTYSLTSAVILSKDGLDDLKSRVEKFSTKSSSKAGYEMADLSRLLQLYRAWSENLGVRESANWPDFVEKLDRLKKNDIRKYIVGLREGRDQEVTTVKPSNVVPVEVNASHEIASAKETAMPPPPTEPPVSTLTEEQRQLIEQKRLEGIRRREERLKLLKTAPNPETPMPHNSAEKDESVSFSQMQTQIISETSQPLDDKALDCSQAPTHVLEKHEATITITTKAAADGIQEMAIAVHSPYSSSQVDSNLEKSDNPKKVRLIDEDETLDARIPKPWFADV